MQYNIVCTNVSFAMYKLTNIQDPTEVGTMVGAVRCSDCPGHLLPTRPTAPDAQWQCDQCSRQQAGVTEYQFL